MKYVYPAIFTEEARGFSIAFHDVPGAITQGENMSDALEKANDALCFMLYHAEQRGEKIPVPSKLESIKVSKSKGEFVQFIACDTDWYKRYYEKKAVKKTLTIPSTLNAMAEREGINFSAVLQEALKRKLNYQS